MRILCTGLVVVALLAARSPASAAKVVGTCSPTKIKFVSSDSFNSTFDGSYVPITDMSLRFVQGGSAPGCVIVELQGYAFADASTSGLISLDARLDGNDDDDYVTGAQPQFAEGGKSWSEANSIKFIWVNVAPGSHTVKAFFRSANGGSVSLNKPTMLVHHVP